MPQMQPPDGSVPPKEPTAAWVMVDGPVYPPSFPRRARRRRTHAVKPEWRFSATGAFTCMLSLWKLLDGASLDADGRGVAGGGVVSLLGRLVPKTRPALGRTARNRIVISVPVRDNFTRSPPAVAAPTPKDGARSRLRPRSLERPCGVGPMQIKAAFIGVSQRPALWSIVQDRL